MNRTSISGRSLPGAFAAGLLVLGFCALLLRHNPELFWNDDYQISILPVFADVARCWSEGHLPLLSPYSWVCGNLAGEYQYGTFSLFINAAVVLIWKFPLSFAQQAAALSISHLFVLAIGAFMLARDRGLTNPLSLMVSLVGALNGWIICWGASDWFGALGAFAWLPWAWWAMERALDERRSRWRFLWPAPFVYLVLTGGFPYTVLMLGVVALWLCLKSSVASRSISSLWHPAAGLVLGLALSAPAWLALFDYVHSSARGEQAGSAAHWQWLVPPAALPGFLWPGWTVDWTNFSGNRAPHAAIELACGTAPPLALIAGLFFRRKEFLRQMKWDLTLLAIVLLITMLPSANVFRWSFRWLPLFHLVLALLAADALMRFRLWQQPLFRFFPAAVTGASLLATYLALPTNPGVPKYRFPASLTNSAPLDPARLYLSVYPPPETAYRIENHQSAVGQTVRPGSTSMWAGVRLINGYSPIRTAGVGRDFAFSTHGEIDPAIGEYLVRWQAGADGLLAEIGVDGIVLAKESPYEPQPAKEWTLVHRSDEGRVYHRHGGAIPAIRSLEKLDVLPNEQFVKARVAVSEDARLQIKGEVDVPANGRPALLVVARPFFDGYRAEIGSKSLAVGSYRGLVPTLRVPAGTHGRLTISYRPWWLFWGGALASFSATVIAASLFVALRERRQRRTGN